MSATDELRRLLDERGVKHYDRWSGEIRYTKWQGNYDMWFLTHDSFETDGELLYVQGINMTPEQAIAATLGRGTCRNVAKPDEHSDRLFTCSECGARGPYGEGTYHLASGATLPDGTVMFGDAWPVWKYCPNCGREVVE